MPEHCCEHGAEIAALRADVASLRRQLQAAIGGDVRHEPRELSASDRARLEVFLPVAARRWPKGQAFLASECVDLLPDSSTKASGRFLARAAASGVVINNLRVERAGARENGAELWLVTLATASEVSMSFESPTRPIQADRGMVQSHS